MTPTAPAVAPRALGVVLLGLVLAACSPAASVAPSATAVPVATPSPAPTVAETPAPTPSPSTATASASAQPDPAIGLKIAAPYELKPLDPALEATLAAQMAQLGGAASLVSVGGRTVVADGKPDGYVQVIALPPGMLSDAVYTALLGAIGPSTGDAFSTDTVSGVSVSSATTPSGALSVFHAGDRIIMTVIPTGGDIDAVTKALIDANQ